MAKRKKDPKDSGPFSKNKEYNYCAGNVPAMERTVLRPCIPVRVHCLCTPQKSILDGKKITLATSCCQMEHAAMTPHVPIYNNREQPGNCCVAKWRIQWLSRILPRKRNNYSLPNGTHSFEAMHFSWRMFCSSPTKTQHSQIAKEKLTREL